MDFPINGCLQYNNRDVIDSIWIRNFEKSEFKAQWGSPGIVGMSVEHKVICMPGVPISRYITASIYSEPNICSVNKFLNDII